MSKQTNGQTNRQIEGDREINRWIDILAEGQRDRVANRQICRQAKTQMNIPFDSLMKK